MIRIISGHLKGQKLAVPEGKEVRPTSDRMRGRVFSILMHHRYPDFLGSRVADFFAGTGALGLEALSRGAQSVCFIEKAQKALSALRANIKHLGVEAQATVLQSDASQPKDLNAPFDFIFMDAPYGAGLTEKALEFVASRGLLYRGGVIIVECGAEEEIQLPEKFVAVDTRKQGIQKTLFLMHRKKVAD